MLRILELRPRIEKATDGLGDADTLFLEKNRIAVGWAKMGDLAALKSDRDAFKARVASDCLSFPRSKPFRQAISTQSKARNLRLKT